jgi:hypothetical protein
MPFTALLLEGSHKTKLVEEILLCPLCAYTLLPKDKEFAALLYEAERALEVPSAAAVRLYGEIRPRTDKAEHHCGQATSK